MILLSVAIYVCDNGQQFRVTRVEGIYMNILLAINCHTIGVGDEFINAPIEEAGFKKVGFLGRAMLPKMPGDEIYLASNPSIAIFGEIGRAGVIATPWLDDPLSRAMNSSTACYAFFNRNVLRYIICMVIGRMGARKFDSEIRSAATRELGRPIESGNIFTWKDGEEVFISELGESGEKSFMHWGLL